MATDSNDAPPENRAPQLEYFLIARSVAVDADRQTLSIFHVLNEIVEEEFPASIDMDVVASWIFDSALLEKMPRPEFQVTVEFRVPGIDEPLSYRGTLVAETRFQSFAVAISDLQIPEPGDLIATLYLNDRRQATHTINLTRPDSD